MDLGSRPASMASSLSTARPCLIVSGCCAWASTHCHTPRCVETPAWRSRRERSADGGVAPAVGRNAPGENHNRCHDIPPRQDRKSTRLNSSHVRISYAVFCLKKKTRIYHSYLIQCCPVWRRHRPHYV